MEIKEDSPPPKFVEKKKERVSSSEPIPYVGLTIPSVNGDFAPIKETTLFCCGFFDQSKISINRWNCQTHIGNRF